MTGSNNQVYCTSESDIFSVRDNLLSSSTSDLSSSTSDILCNFKCLYTNCDGISNKVNEFELVLSEAEPHIIFLTETKLNKSILSQEVFPTDKYLIYRKDRDAINAGGGVCILVRKDIISFEVNNLLIQGCECMCCEVRIGPSSVLVCCMYRPPSYDLNPNLNDQFLKQFKNLANSHYDQILICGDFNYNNINWKIHEVNASVTSDTQIFYNTTQDCFLHQNVEEFTRKRGNNEPSTLDLIFTKTDLEIANLEHTAPLGASDHDILSFELVTTDPVIYPKISQLKYNYWKGNFRALDMFYSQNDWETNMSSLSSRESERYFLRIYNQGLEKYVPKIKYCINAQQKPKWMNHESVIWINKKKMAWSRYRRRKTTLRYEMYCRVRNTTTSKIREAKMDFEKRLAKEAKKNPKGVYSYMRSKTKVKEDIIRLKRDDGSFTRNDKESCELLNSKYQSVFVQEPPGDSPPPDYVFNGPTLEDINFSVNEVKELLKNLKENSAPGPDNVACKILKECRESLSLPIFIIMKKSFESGCLPVNWLRANITSIFKKGKRDEPLNYRPISLTSVICKLMEKILRKRIIEHLENNNIFSAHQHGFRAHRSCLTALLEYFEDITKALDENVPIDAVYLDCQKAFDSVPTKRLLTKVHAVGIRGKLYEWIKAFLTGREQRVQIRGESSSWCNVTSGVPQGSVLGPVLFLIYINDIVMNIESTIKIFADDAKVYRKIRSFEDSAILQTDLDHLSEWSRKWLLKFNSQKCKVMHFGHSNPKNAYSLNQNLLEISTEEKDLGVHVSDSFKFSNHISKIAAKANSILGRINRAFENKDKEIIKLLYVSMVRPHLEYAVQSWSPYLRKDIYLLEQVQRRATRLIPEIRHLPYEERLKALNLTSLEDRRTRGDLIEVFKMVHGIENIDYKKFFSISTGGPSCQTRGHRLKIELPFSRTEKRKNFFSIRSINAWNKLPSVVVLSPNVNTFKNRYDDHMNKVRAGTLTS